MNKQLLLIILITGNFLYAQERISTDMLNPSTQLEIQSLNREVLIPQSPLSSKTDLTTITTRKLGNIL